MLTLQGNLRSKYLSSQHLLDLNSAGLEILEPELGVGVTTAHPLLGKMSYQEPNPREVRTRMRSPPNRRGLPEGRQE